MTPGYSIQDQQRLADVSSLGSSPGYSSKSINRPSRRHSRGRTVDSRRARTVNILIIEDDPSIRGAIQSILSLNGYSVTLAENGEEGMSRFKEGTYDMVFTDLGMPGSSGWEVVSAIKHLRNDVPVVVMTGWPEEIIRQALDPNDVQEVLVKPFIMDSLLDLVGKLAN